MQIKLILYKNQNAKKDIFFDNLLLATKGGWGEIILWLLYIIVYRAKKLASI